MSCFSRLLFAFCGSVVLQIFPFSTAIFTDIALTKSKILFLIQWGVLKPPEAILIHTLSKLRYLIHKLYLTNHLSFLDLLNCGTHCHPLLSLNPKICHLLNLTSTNLILSPSLLKLPHFLSFSFVGLCYRPYGLSPTLLIKNTRLSQAVCKDSRHVWYIALYIICTQLYRMC